MFAIRSNITETLSVLLTAVSFVSSTVDQSMDYY